MIFKRWTIRFKHDKSPIDAGAYVHKAAAIKALDAMANKDKLEVIIMQLCQYIDDKS